jgi:hypothetical protein
MSETNKQSKKRLRKMNEHLVTKLEEVFKVNVYQDQVSAEEEKSYNYIIFETGGFERTDSLYTLKQNVLVRYYSENRDDLDEVLFDLISTIDGIKYTFVRSDKTSIQKGETDSFVDELIVHVTRSVKYGC